VGEDVRNSANVPTGGIPFDHSSTRLEST